MIHYLNDLALWHRQGEEYQRRIKSKPPVHPMIAVARQREKRTWTVMSEHSTNPLAFSASGESKRRHSYVATEPRHRSPGSFYALNLLGFR
jgi:hypothetical protein